MALKTEYSCRISVNHHPVQKAPSGQNIAFFVPREIDAEEVWVSHTRELFLLSLLPVEGFFKKRLMDNGRITHNSRLDLNALDFSPIHTSVMEWDASRRCFTVSLEWSDVARCPECGQRLLSSPAQPAVAEHNTGR